MSLRLSSAQLLRRLLIVATVAVVAVLFLLMTG